MFMTLATACSWSPPIGSARSTGSCPNGIPDKGRILTGLSAFWFQHLHLPNHLISTDVDDFGLDLTGEEREALAGRSMLVRKVRIVPFECVVRGYLAGSGWKEYRASGSVCGIRLPAGLVEARGSTRSSRRPPRRSGP